MRRGRGGVRRAIRLALLLPVAATLALGLYILLLLVEKAELSAEPLPTLPLLILVGLLAMALAGFWIANILIEHHFTHLERLRGALLVAAGTGGEARNLGAAVREAGAETRRLGAAAVKLAGHMRPDAKEAAVASERLSAILAAASEGLVVVTDTGLVSLVNSAALLRLDSHRVAVGTSVYAAFAREPLIEAHRRAQASARPVRQTLVTVEGDALEAVVVDLGPHNGLVLCLPGLPVRPEVKAGREAAGDLTLEHDLRLHDAVPEMQPVDDQTPLEVLPALAFDSETTGLDVATARIVSLGAVRLQGRRIYTQANLDCLVRPDVAIPASATAVHGIGNAMVAEAPPIAELLPRLRTALGAGALVGHNIGYDLAILANEAARCGQPWSVPPALDTGLLMAALEPELIDLNLETIAARLGVAIEGRHTALGDALVTAEIFVRLLPRLEDAGVRTFGEARAFAQRAWRLRGRQVEAGWQP